MLEENAEWLSSKSDASNVFKSLHRKNETKKILLAVKIKNKEVYFYLKLNMKSITVSWK